VRQDGEPGELDPSVSLAAYRVVQEALTNVGKHAGPGTAAEVRLAWTAGRLQVEVTDDGRGGAAGSRLSTGRGLLGLAERVALVGGSLARGPRPGGGYRLAAELPAGPAEVAG
jgi:signal transduction histidine kinase